MLWTNQPAFWYVIPNQWKSAETAILDEYKHVTTTLLTSVSPPLQPSQSRPGRIRIRSCPPEGESRLFTERRDCRGEALLTEEVRKEKELFDQANKAAYVMMIKVMISASATTVGATVLRTRVEIAQGWYQWLGGAMGIEASQGGA